MVFKFKFTCTFLNASRQHEKLPKHSSVTGFCVIISVIGKIRCTSIGNRYHWNWTIESSNSLNALLIRWPSSHAMNTTTNVLKPLNPNRNSSAVWLSWLVWIKERSVKKGTLKWPNEYSTQLIRFEWLALHSRVSKDFAKRQLWWLADIERQNRTPIYKFKA